MKNLLYIFIGILLIAGCENAVNVEPVSQITSGNYWNTPGDVTGYLTGIYTRMRGEFNTTLYFEDRGDSFNRGMLGGASNAWIQNITPDSAPNWVDFYNIIHHCNLLLQNTQDIDFAQQADKDRALAETYFIRAYTYFSLLRIWGDVPLVLEPTKSDIQPKPERTPASEVMDQVLQDINMAIELFPEDGLINKSRASKPASYALKGDALLWKAKVLGGGQSDLEGGLTALNNAINTLGLELVSNFGHIFSTDNKNNQEIIFSLHFERDEAEGQYSSRLKPRTALVESAQNFGELPHARNGARDEYAPSEEMLNAFNKYSGDERKDASIIEGIDPDGNVISIYDNKFKGEVYEGDRHFTDDIVIYRLGGLLLLKAEILAALNRTSEAIIELDKVRNRADIGNYTGPTDKQSVEEEILNERFRELWLELKRWPDLMRFHFAGTVDVYQEVPNLSGKQVPLYFPIPQSIIELNPNLDQTEGY